MSDLDKIEEIYYQALQIPVPRREAFLSDSCGGDEQLRREVESLLKFEQQAKDFIESPPKDLAASFVSYQTTGKIIGQKLNHYQIIEQIGIGGMGEVYLAEDTKLQRKVALKILPSEFAEDKNRMSRFVREAKSASALNHPNIITIYEIGESGETHFIATEFIDGKTLNDYAKANPLNYKSALEIAIQIVSALDEAHLAGIVHRDIKPDNIMIRPNGLAKILDFGIAKLAGRGDTETRRHGEEETALIPASPLPRVTASSSTSPGMIIGTANYMSPEQAKGKDVDARTDIFSFGVVLYEMISGHLPFAGESAMEMIGAILYQAPKPLSANVPTEIAEIINKCLLKDRDERYQTIKEVGDDLKQLQMKLLIEAEIGRTATPNREEVQTQILHPPTTDEKLTISTAESEEGFWVAVLPFKSIGTSTDITALAEGFSEEIIMGLSRFSYLRVIARSSTLKYANNSDDVRVVGKELGARYVIEGSLRQSGSMLRVTVQLADAMNGVHLWSESYNRQFRAEDIFALQDELTPQIVSTVADQYGALVHSMSESLRGKSVGSYSAHEAVLRAFGYLERISPEEHLEVRDILEAAISVTPDHSNCQSMLSLMYWHEYANGYNTKPDSLTRAYAAAQRAVAAAPTNQLAYYALANVLFYQKDFPAFRPVAERALALNRMDASTTALIGTLIAYSGDWENGLNVVAQTKRLNPNHPGWYHLAAFYDAYRRGDYRSALENVLNVNMHGYYSTYAGLAATYAQLGEKERATAALRELLVYEPKFGKYARSGYGRWFDAELTELLLDGLRKAGLEIP